MFLILLECFGFRQGHGAGIRELYPKLHGADKTENNG